MHEKRPPHQPVAPRLTFVILASDNSRIIPVCGAEGGKKTLNSLHSGRACS